VLCLRLLGSGRLLLFLLLLDLLLLGCLCRLGGSGGGRGSGRCLLLLDGDVLLGLVNDGGLASLNLYDLGLAEYGVEVSEDVGVLAEEGRVDNVLGASLEDGRDDDVGIGDALANEERLALEDLVQVRVEGGGGGLAVLNGLLVERALDDRGEPLAERGEQGGVAKVGPLEDLGLLLGRLAEEVALVGLRGEVEGDGRGLGDEEAVVVESGDL